MKRQCLKLCALAFTVVLLTGACVSAPTPAPTPTPAPPTPTPGPVERVMAFQEAFNKGSVDETAAMFLNDEVGVIVESLGLEFGPRGLRNTLEYAAATGLKLEFSDCKPEGEAVNCQLLLRDNACLKSSGLDPAHGTAKIKFLGDKMNLLTTTMAEGDGTKFINASILYSDWGRLERPDLVEKLNKSPGADITARQQGELLAQLCKDWAVASSRTPTTAPPTAAPPTPAADLAAPVKAYVAALNAGDVDGALALFTEDVKWGDEIVRANGKEQLRTKLDWLIAEEVKQQITDCQPQSDRVICHLSRVGACWPAPGATDGLPVKLVFIYQPDGKVQQAEAGHDGPQWDALNKWWDDQAAWARANRADEWAKSQDRTKEGGLIDAKLCKEYAATLGPGNKTPTP